MFIGKETVVKKQDFDEKEGLLYREAVKVKAGWLTCQRCGTQTKATACLLPSGHYYCPACLEFGRLTDQHLLVRQPPSETSCREVHCHWRGRRTVYQEEIAQKLVGDFQKGHQSLLWAVTGAGKTEMLFPLIETVLASGGRVCFSAPRIDVCREVLPRLQEAFPAQEIIFLYGEGEPYQETALLVSTTHQLLHFYQAFDLLVIDEIDAFPYHEDQRLHFAASHAVKETGRRVYLSATPSRRLVAACGDRVYCLPARYHRRPLIQPQCCFWNDWANLPEKKRSLKKLVALIDRLLQHNHLLIFCPSIAFMKRLAAALGPLLSKPITSVSAKDPDRAEKIAGMRHQAYQVLLTSTILERGVTFAKISVLVIGADHPVFTKAALVQIAGRVDRKGEFTHGEVIFCYHEMTYQIRQACQEIRQLNQLAAKVGAIDAL